MPSSNTKSISVTAATHWRLSERKAATGETFDDIVRQACADIVADPALPDDRTRRGTVPR